MEYKKLQIPQTGSTEAEILQYRDDAFGDRATLRCRKLENAARNLLYFYNRQWIEVDTNTLYQGSRGYHFRDKFKNSKTPKPVFNWIAPAVNIEMAALGRGKLIADVRPTSRDPRVQAAAKVAKGILQHRLKDLNWADKRAQFTFLDIVCGISIIKSFWDESYETVGYYDNPNAKQCLTCGYKTSGLEAKAQVEEAGVEAVQAVPPNCPYCEAQGLEHPLVDLQLDPEQASELGSDGAPLGIPAPKGQTALEVVSPFDFYPENSGIDQDWNSMKVWRQATPRSLDWVFARFPELEGQVEPDEPRELMKNHPVLGTWDIFGHYDANLDADLYANYIMVYEIYCERTVKFPNGRAIVIVGDKLALDGELYRAVGPNSVKTVCYAGVNWEQKHREVWGKALVDDLVSPQNVYNGLASLELESIARTGSPNVILPEGSSADGPEFFEMYDAVGKVIRYRIDPLNPQAKPEILGGVTTPQGVSNAKNEALAAIQNIQGPASIERGEAPKNITTTSGLQFLDEQADKRRGYRLDAIIQAFEKIWKHQLDLLWTLRVDDDFYQAEAEDGTWELKQYNKQAIMGQTLVEISHESEVSKSLYDREAVREAMADGLYGDPMSWSPITRQRLLEIKGLPQDIVAEKNYQIEMVKQRWVDFVDLGTVPTIDPTTDDPVIQFEGYKGYLSSEEGRRIAEQMGWDKVLKQIVGWELRLQQAELLDLQARTLYGTDNPAVAQPMYAQLQAQFEQSMMQYQQTQVQAEKVVAETGQAPMLQAPPQPPPPPIFLPGDKADHIYGIWAQMILEKGGLPQVQPVAIGGAPDLVATLQKQDNYIKFRAVVDAYKLMAKEAVTAAAPVVQEANNNPAAQGPQGFNPGMQQLNVASPQG